MAKLTGIELLDYVKNAVESGKTLEDQCIDSGYVFYNGNPDPSRLREAILKAENHAQILRAGSMHPFLLHAYTNTPISLQSKRLNELIDKLSGLVDLSFIDELDEEFMDNFLELGNPDGGLYEYEFGSFDSRASAKEFILEELESSWWLKYYANTIDTLLSNRKIRDNAISLMSTIKRIGGDGLLNELVLDAISNQFEGLNEAGKAVSTDIYTREWRKGDLIKFLGDGGLWKSFYLSLQRSYETYSGNR